MSSRSSSEGAAGALPRWVEVARVRRPHGLRGEVLVDSTTDVPGRLQAGSEVQLLNADGLRRPVRIVSSRPHGSGALIRLHGWESRTQAEDLRGASLEVDRRRVPPPPAGSYYLYELVGCACHDRQAGELGRVSGILEDGGGLLLEVEQGDTVVPVPFVEPFIDQIDVEGRRIRLNLPPGLIEACASRS